MVSDPWAKTAGPVHTAVAVVLQVRAAQLQVLLWERHSSRSPASGRFRAAPSPGRDARGVDPPPPGDQGRRPRARPSRTARDAQRPGAQPTPLGARDRISGLVPRDVDPALPADTHWHPVDRLPELAFDHRSIVLAGRERLRAKLSYTNIGFALAPERLHHLRAARPVPGRARPRPLGDQPAACPAPAPSARPDRQPPRARAGGRSPGRAVSASASAHSRSPTSSPFCARRADTPPLPKAMSQRHLAR